MYEKDRKAIDDDGNEVVLTEKQMSQYVITADGLIKYNFRPHFFGPDGKQLAPESSVVFRTPFDKRYRLAD